MADAPPSGLVVVLSFQGREDTLRCVASLTENAPDHTILVVDNASNDGTLDAVEARFPQVRTHQTGTNLGFAGGMNVGISWGLEQGFDVITVLNNDTVVDPGCLGRLESAVLGRLAAASPRVVYLDAPDQTWFAGGRLDPSDGLPRHDSAAEVAQAAARAPRAGGAYEVELLAGCCVVASAATWQRVGSFDERYFLNFEDSDWSLRARLAGVPLLVDPDATVQHRVSASFVGQHSYLGTYYYTRNLLLFARTWREHGTRTGAMLWNRVLRPLPASVGRDGPREALRRTWVVAVGVGAHLTGRYGRASRRIEQRTARWARPRA